MTETEGENDWPCSGPGCERKDLSEFQYFCSDNCSRKYYMDRNPVMQSWNKYMEYQSRAALARYRSILEYRDRHREEGESHE